LPGEYFGAGGVFAFERFGEGCSAVVIEQVLVMEVPHVFKLASEVGDGALGEHRDAVFFAFRFADVDQVLVEVKVFDSKGRAFGEAEACAIEDAGHEELRAVEVREDEADLGG